MQDNFTRKEVRALLKRQIAASSESYNRMGGEEVLVFGIYAKEYLDEHRKIKKRLKNVQPIKF